MDKPKKSASAIFMYWMIGVTLLLAILCFSLYYGGIYPQDAVLWTGVTAFTIMYHLWMRIIMGNVSRLYRLHYSQWWFRERPFEKKLCEALRVKRWKGRALTYDPRAFSLKDHSLEEVAYAMTKAETDHWVNVLISLSTLLFAIPWGSLWIFLVTAMAAILFDSQFILIQRYNRPRIVRLIQKEQAKAARQPV